jgi:hypothetical protein
MFCLSTFCMCTNPFLHSLAALCYDKKHLRLSWRSMVQYTVGVMHHIFHNLLMRMFLKNVYLFYCRSCLYKNEMKKPDPDIGFLLRFETIITKGRAGKMFEKISSNWHDFQIFVLLFRNSYFRNSLNSYLYQSPKCTVWFSPFLFSLSLYLSLTYFLILCGTSGILI